MRHIVTFGFCALAMPMLAAGQTKDDFEYWDTNNNGDRTCAEAKDGPDGRLWLPAYGDGRVDAGIIYQWLKRGRSSDNDAVACEATPNAGRYAFGTGYASLENDIIVALPTSGTVADIATTAAQDDARNPSAAADGFSIVADETPVPANRSPASTATTIQSLVRKPLFWVGSILLATISSWLLGFFNQFLPSPPRVVRAIKNTFRGARPPSAEKFWFVLTWIEDDPKGTYTKRIAKDFRQTKGVELVRSARIVKAVSDTADTWQRVMEEQAHKILNKWNADVAIVGSATPDAGALSLWFVPILGDSTLDRRSYYVLNNYNAMLPEPLREELRAQLVATALSAAAAVGTRAYGKLLTDEAKAVVNRIHNLIKSPTIGEPVSRADLHVALGATLRILGARETVTERLQAAVDAYNSALRVQTRKDLPHEWAATQSNLGDALRILGAREEGVERLQAAVDA